MLRTRFIGLLLGLGLLFGLAACATGPTPAPTPTPEPPTIYMDGGRCTVIVGEDATTWSKIFEVLGVPYYKNQQQGSLPAVRVNGELTGSGYNVSDGDVVVLAERKSDCEGVYNRATAVSFPDANGGERELSGFHADNPITAARLLDKAMYQACKAVQTGHYGIGMGNDIFESGCIYPTAVKISYRDAPPVCETYLSVADAYNGTSTRLGGAQYLAVFTGYKNTDLSAYCK